MSGGAVAILCVSASITVLNKLPHCTRWMCTVTTLCTLSLCLIECMGWQGEALQFLVRKNSITNFKVFLLAVCIYSGESGFWKSLTCNYYLSDVSFVKKHSVCTKISCSHFCVCWRNKNLLLFFFLRGELTIFCWIFYWIMLWIQNKIVLFISGQNVDPYIRRGK